MSTSTTSDIRSRCRAAVLEALEQMGGQGMRREILTRAERLAGFSPEELALLPPERARATYSRLIDHQLSWALSNLKRDGVLENPRWSVWQLRREEAPGAVERLAAPSTPTRLAQLKSMPYSEYLKTREWQHTRLAALNRAGHHCQLDAGHHTPRLDVHHNNYDRLGEELAADVVVLCGPCHERHHQLVSVGPPDEAVRPDDRDRSGLLRRLLQRRR